MHLVTHIFSRQNDKKLYDSLLYKDGDFDDSQLPRTIKSLIDPCLLAHLKIQRHVRALLTGV